MAALASAILVVDDDVDLREALLEALECEGFRALGAASAEEALGMLPDLPRPCLVLLDNLMPGMGGAGFLRFMGGHADTSAFPIVLMNCVAKEVPPGSAAIDVLRKPFSVDALLTVVEQRCVRRAGQAQFKPKAELRPGANTVEPLG